MGDVAMTIPVLRALTHQHPELKITILTRALFSPFFRDLKNVTVFPADVKGKHKGLSGLFKLSKALKKLEIDVVADLHNVLRSKILKFLFFGTQFIQIDKGRTEKKALVSGKIFQQLKTTHQRYVDVFDALGFKLDLSNPTFPNKSILNEKTLAIIGQNSKKMIGIAPFAAHEGKMYPLGLMERVIETLSKDYKVILFGGGEKEVAILNNFEASFENTINIAGKLLLDEELDVISNLDVMLSMDSGNAHIAAMLGIKVVTIWGVTHPYAGFAPFNQAKDYALLSDRNRFPEIPTSVYGSKYPESYKNAAGSITPETVIEKVIRITLKQ
ncbi:glycosyltransferase family 9 protein [Flavivirga rizhaonensis]|uniref:Lipopolysaccharide heptosyltransferase family protein n=1 Tax=Flavivirga rizhaonensis TaxID=2559571 RepID=A0A4S1E008_9FLAO|nr:glycosyltransferase family 9 protein [Flavivirga rizhaonensis]TGV03876.1 lipopolysaccharide heptosyltransferase family protein [Flavivirga rizhaonensis]